MRNLMMLRHASRCMAFIGRSIALTTWKQRAWRQDDALARLDDRMLRDIGIDRCEVRYLTAHECAISKIDQDLEPEPRGDLPGPQDTHKTVEQCM
jgi:uncharacterized protein YjiS (DUF1127 family)